MKKRELRREIAGLWECNENLSKTIAGFAKRLEEHRGAEIDLARHVLAGTPVTHPAALRRLDQLERSDLPGYIPGCIVDTRKDPA